MNKLDKLRQKIDRIDGKILSLLKERGLTIKEMGGYKKVKKIKISDKTREKEILKRTRNNFEKNIYKSIIKESKKLQQPLTTRRKTDIINRNK